MSAQEQTAGHPIVLRTSPVIRSLKKRNAGTIEKQRARYASISNKEKRIKSRSNLLVYSEVFQEENRFNQRIQSIHKIAQL